MNEKLIEFGKECCEALSERLELNRADIILNNVADRNECIWLKISMKGKDIECEGKSIHGICKSIEQIYNTKTA